MTTTADSAYAHPLARGVPSEFAVGWGHDQFGVWEAYELNGVAFRMRWIPPGTFWMGTTEEEQKLAMEKGGVGDWIRNEGPRHLVKISEGFWLGEFPVTQKLWTAVMGAGNNPSHFKSDDARSDERPVEQVSWHDARAFIEKANASVSDLGLRLPWEAEWEYACRAGTETATYAGDLVYQGANDAPVLERIAWYGGNSAIDFDLEEGVDSSAWLGRSGRAGMAGTHPVGRKDPNGWGLHDMLGNVWEWCRDGLRDYGESARKTAVVDPRGPAEDGRVVVRGGARDTLAAYVRAGARDAGGPGYRWDGVGFRLARGLKPGT